MTDSAGRRARPAPQPASVLRRTASLSIEEAWGIWQRTLAAGDSRPPIVALLDEWHGYSGLSYRDMLTAAFTGEEETHERWRRMRPESASEIASFYDETTSWLPVLLWWHGTARGSNAPARAAAAAERVFKLVGARRILDFGCGVGTTALFLAERGFEVVLADVSRDSLRLAEWRLRRRGHKPETLYLRERGIGQLPPGSFDGIVVFDVFEHMRDHREAVAALDAALAPGGVICFNQVFIAEEEPGHFPLRGEPLRLLHEAGYRLAHVSGLFWIAQKARLPLVERAWQRASLRARIRAARGVHRWNWPIARGIAFRVIRHALS